MMYFICDTPYNQENFPSLVGTWVDNPPSTAIAYARRKKIGT